MCTQKAKYFLLYHQNCLFFLCCDGNIGLSSIATHKIIALAIFRQQKLSLIILCCIFFSCFVHWLLTFYNALVHGFFSVLFPIKVITVKEIVKKKETYHIAFKSHSIAIVGRAIKIEIKQRR